MTKTIHPVPKSQTEWLASVRSFCLECCGKSTITVRECTNGDCQWWACRLAPVQLTLFDKHFREIFYQDVKPCIEAQRGEFTIKEVRADYETRYNGTRGAAHPNWWGRAMFKFQKPLGLRCVRHERSTAPKRRGGTVAVWHRD